MPMKQYKASDAVLHKQFQSIEARVREAFPDFETRYVDLGVKMVRVIIHAPEYIPLMEKQLTYTLRDTADSYDETLVIWNSAGLKEVEPDVVQGFNLQIRQVLSVNEPDNCFSGYDAVSSTRYYAVPDLAPEEFIKNGHIFVKPFYEMLKTPSSNLVHGACVGIDGKGVLFCARGQRGKSTLTVLSMLAGFEYVSDDYLVLAREDDGLYTWPIYSIITLSPTMYNELYDELDGTRFVSNNARKDKYVINIANCHDRFRSRYPVSLCMFPEIVSDPEPSIVPCDEKEKGRAMTHLAHSTMLQMADLKDFPTTKKIIGMVEGKPFYRINLCRDIRKNVEVLREFLKNYNG